MHIHSVRVRHTEAGRVFPFDRVYLVKNDDRGLVKNLFKFAIIMPLVGGTKALLQQVVVDARVIRGHKRAVEVNTFARGVEENTSYGVAEVLDLQKDDWLVVVPLLPRKKEKSGTVKPSYLTASRWTTSPVAGTRKRATRKALKAKHLPLEEPVEAPTAFNQQAYLQTPEKDIRPPCLLCPRMIFQRAGECHLGDLVCYGHLPLGLKEMFDLDKEASTGPTLPERPNKKGGQ